MRWEVVGGFAWFWFLVVGFLLVVAGWLVSELRLRVWWRFGGFVFGGFFFGGNNAMTRSKSAKKRGFKKVDLALRHAKPFFLPCAKLAIHRNAPKVLPPPPLCISHKSFNWPVT